MMKFEKKLSLIFMKTLSSKYSSRPSMCCVNVVSPVTLVLTFRFIFLMQEVFVICPEFQNHYYPYFKRAKYLRNAKFSLFLEKKKGLLLDPVMNTEVNLNILCKRQLATPCHQPLIRRRCHPLLSRISN